VKPFHRDMCSSPLGDNPVPFLVEKGPLQRSPFGRSAASL